MEIQEMTSMSYFLLIMAGILAVVAVILFFLLDIPKCVRMVFGVKFRNRKKSDQEISYRHQKVLGNQMDMTTEKLHEKESFIDGSEETLLLENVMDCRITDTESTQLLPETDKTQPLIDDSAETELMETDELELIQDIVFVQDMDKTEKGTE